MPEILKPKGEKIFCYPLTHPQRQYVLERGPADSCFKGLIPVDKFEFYAIGGVGAYFLATDIDDSDNFRRHRDSNTDSETLFGGFLGLGATFNFTPRFFVGVEGKYLWTTTTTVINADVNLTGIQATANIGFRF